MMLLGCATSFLMTRYFVISYDEDLFEEKLHQMLFIQAAIESVVFILILIFFKSIYINKWGQVSPFRDELSDLGDSNYEGELNTESR